MHLYFEIECYYYLDRFLYDFFHCIYIKFICVTVYWISQASPEKPNQWDTCVQVCVYSSLHTCMSFIYVHTWNGELARVLLGTVKSPAPYLPPADSGRWWCSSLPVRRPENCAASRVHPSPGARGNDLSQFKERGQKSRVSSSFLMLLFRPPKDWVMPTHTGGRGGAAYFTEPTIQMLTHPRTSSHAHLEIMLHLGTPRPVKLTQKINYHIYQIENS